MKILTFDIEEWFHILDNGSTKTVHQWKNFGPRIHQNMDRIFQILEASNTKATFFVLGWIAEIYPEIVRAINDKGYEIGSHTATHQLVYEQNKKSFQSDVEKSVKTLEDITGKKVTLFRAPGFSITEQTKWAFEVLYELGITTDSSVFPATRCHGGMPNYGSGNPSLLSYNGIELKEFPINTNSLFGKSFIFSGGGYFRVTPYHLLKKWTSDASYVMSYFHPRDLDAEQPMIKGLSCARKFKSYVGLKQTKPKLEKWLKDFEFIDIEMANNQIDWKNVKTVQL